MALPPPYDPYYLAQPEFVYSNDGNGINTLFVSGLPDDIKAREIHNLFRRRPGFENCQLKYTGRGNQVTGNFMKKRQLIAAKNGKLKNFFLHFHYFILFYEVLKNSDSSTGRLRSYI